MTDRPDSFMPLWIGDYLADTMRLTRDQHGGYLLLIMAYWRDGKPLPDDDEALSSITKSSEKEWKKLRPILSKFFKVGEGVWRHGRVDQELHDAAERYAAKVERAKAGAAARWNKDASSNAQASDKQCSSNANHNHTPTEKNNPSGYSSSDRRAKGNARAPKGAAPPSPQVDWADEIPEWADFKSKLSATEWQAWFSTTHPNGAITTLVAPSEFAAEQLAERYGSKLEAHFGEAFQIKTKGDGHEF